MILMASLVASQLPNAKPPLEINPTLIFLAAITEIKTDSKNREGFQYFNLIDETLFTILKRLEILEDLQNFLLG